MQNGRSAARDWFIQTAAKVNSRILQNNTAQGTYVVAADGSAYAFNNNRSVARLAAMLDTGLKSFLAQPPGRVEIPGADLPWGSTPPEGASVIRIFTRIRPVPEGANESNKIVARDHLWILKEEIKQLVETGKVPEQLVKRIARFHMVDNVRGEPDMWAPSEITSSSMECKKSGEGTYVLTGSFSMQTKNGARGFIGRPEIRLTIDGRAYRIMKCRGFTEVTAWGDGTYTGGSPAGKFKIVQAWVEVNDAYSKVVPPQAIFFGKEYFQP